MMNDKLHQRCQLLIDNRDAIRSAFFWQAGAMHLCAALVYTLRGLHADTDRLKRSLQLIRQRVGVFNNFRSTSELALAAMLDVTGDPGTVLDRALTIYAALKDQFFTSSYLPMCAVMIAQHTPTSHYDEVIAATRQLYTRIRKEHPFLTGCEDCTYCTLMALTAMEHDTLLNDMEAVYSLLKGQFFSSDAVQALSHTLSLYPGAAADKVEKVMVFYHDLKALGHKWGTGFELPMLGVVALTHENRQQLIEQIIETETWLKQQRGFGFWGSVTRAQRLMYAGILVNAACTDDSSTNVTSMTINSTIAAIIAQQAATTAMIASSSH